MNSFSRASLVWCGFFLIAMINGVFREGVIKLLVDEPWAHHFSAVTAIVLFYTLASLVWPYLGIRSMRQAAVMGLYWLVLTVLAETFIVGRLLGQQPWQEIWNNYNLFAGNLWPLVVLFVGLLPPILFRIKAMHSSKAP